MWLIEAPAIISERRLSFLCAQVVNRGWRRKVRVETKTMGVDHVAHKTSEPLVCSHPRSQGPKPRRWSSEDIALSAASLGLAVIQTFGAGDKTKTKSKEFPVCGSHMGTFLVFTPCKLTLERLREKGRRSPSHQGEGGAELPRRLGWARGGAAGASLSSPRGA